MIFFWFYSWVFDFLERNLSKDSCGSRESFFLVVVVCDFRVVSIELESKVERGLGNKWFWEMGNLVKKGFDFFFFKKMCFVRFIFLFG